MNLLFHSVFWLSIALLAYTYLGYPALLWLWSRRKPPPAWSPSPLPSVTVIAVVQDEADRIARRIENLLALDYPRHLLELVIASDGSRDDTVARALARAAGRVKVLDYPEPRGKAATLADAVAASHGEILVFCDTRQEIERGALRALVTPFEDPTVGVVSGTLSFVVGEEGIARGVGLYWRYETFLRQCETRIDSMVGATGALYAIRCELFDPIPPDTLDDDLAIPYQALRRGYRVVLEPGARAIDRAPEDPAAELKRKVRTQAGIFQLLRREPWLLDPRRNRIWLQTLSHKAFRLLGPLFLLLALVTSLSLWAHPFYRGAGLAQIALYAAAAAGALAGRTGVTRLLALPYTFCLLQAAIILGLFRFLTNSQPVTWKSA